MKKIVFLFSLMGFYFSCSTETTVSSDKTTAFHMNMPSQLYFKNMRSFYYSEQSKPKGTRVYTLKKMEQAPYQASVIPRIHQKWLADEAYLIFEAAKYPITIVATIAGQDKKTFVLKHQKDYQKHRQLANLIYQNQRTIQLVISDSASEKTDWWEDDGFRQNMLLVLADYMKLVE